MKVVDKAVGFQPVTIILETPEELALVKAVFAVVNPNIDKVKVRISEDVRATAKVNRLVTYGGSAKAKGKEYYLAVKGILAPMIAAGEGGSVMVKRLKAEGLTSPSNLPWNIGRLHSFIHYYKMR